MGVFAKNKRTFAIGMFFVRRPLDHGRDGGIHRTNDVGDTVAGIVDGFGRLLIGGPEINARLVMQRTTSVVATNPSGHGVVIGAVATLITKRPDDDGRVVFVALDHPHRALDEGCGVAPVAADLMKIIVRLKVGFIDDVETEFVAHVEPVGIVRIVRGADGVDVEALHRQRVEPHRFAVERLALRVVVIVPVHALDQDALAVDQQHPVAHFDAAKTDARRRDLDSLALRTLQRDDEPVKVRRLRRPEPRLFDDLVELGLKPRPSAMLAGGHNVLQRLREYFFALGIEELRLDFPVLLRLRGEADLRGNLQPAVLVMIFETGPCEDIGEIDRRGRIHIDLAMQAAHPPLVLVLDERRVRPFHDGRCDDVAATEFNERRDVELGRQPRILAQADRLAVDVDIEHAFGAAEMKDDATIAPTGGEIYLGAKTPGRIFFRHARRLVPEGHLHVRVVRLIERVLQRPVSRHGDFLPIGARVRSKAGRDEIDGNIFRSLGEMKVPVAVQREIPRRFLAHIGQGQAGVGIGIRRGAHRQPVDFYRFRRHPGRRAAKFKQIEHGTFS